MKHDKFTQALQEHKHNMKKESNSIEIMLEEKEKEIDKFANRNTMLMSKLADAGTLKKS